MSETIFYTATEFLMANTELAVRDGVYVLSSRPGEQWGVGETLAPRKEDVQALWKDEIDFEQFRARYLYHLRMAYAKRPTDFDPVTFKGVVIVTCTCQLWEEECHRELLVETLMKVAERREHEARYEGQLTVERLVDLMITGVIPRQKGDDDNELLQDDPEFVEAAEWDPPATISGAAVGDDARNGRREAKAG